MADDRFGNVDRFDNAEVLDTFIERLQEYRDEAGFDVYSDGCFVEDVMYFLGVAIDEEVYRNADGYRRFIMRYVWPFAKKINANNKAMFTRRLK